MITKPLQINPSPKEVGKNEVFVPIKQKQMSIPNIKSNTKIYSIKSRHLNTPNDNVTLGPHSDLTQYLKSVDKSPNVIQNLDHSILIDKVKVNGHEVTRDPNPEF